MDLVEVEKRKGAETARHPWELARFNIVNKILKDVITDSPDFTVLDIGCGDIFFILGMSELYPKVQFYAIDIAFTDEIIVKYKELAKGKNIFLFKSLDDAAANLKKAADLILLLDVVEHISDDKAFLKMLHDHSVVNEKTNVMITVPAFQKLFCSHDHFLGHYRRYTNTTLLKTLEECGFKKIRLGYFFFSLIPPRILQVWKEKISKPDLNSETTGLVEWNKSKGVTNFIKNVLLFDYKVYKFIKSVTGLSLPGLSNYILCKKSV